jgi:hypothetical protein
MSLPVYRLRGRSAGKPTISSPPLLPPRLESTVRWSTNPISLFIVQKVNRDPSKHLSFSRRPWFALRSTPSAVRCLPPWSMGTNHQRSNFMRCSIILAVFVTGVAYSQSFPTSVSSPDGRLNITFQTATNLASGDAARRSLSPHYLAAPGGGQLIYRVSFRGKTLIEPSALALER